MRPAPRVRIQELPSQELDVEIVDARKLAQYQMHEHWLELLVRDECGEPLRVVRPAVARDQRSRLPMLHVPERWIHHRAQR